MITMPKVIMTTKLNCKKLKFSPRNIAENITATTANADATAVTTDTDPVESPL